MTVRWLAAWAMAALCCVQPARAAADACDVDVLLSVDYVQRSLSYAAQGLSDACLTGFAARGLPVQAQDVWRASETDAWSVHGQLPGAQLTPASDGSWTAQLDVDLRPGDQVRLLLPFVAIDYPHVDPPPANLQALVRPSMLALDGRTPNDALIYQGSTPGADAPTRVVIPFKPVQKNVSLTLTPLYGRMLLGDRDAFRVSGVVTFAVAGPAPNELIRHCQTPPGFSTDSYRSADVLFSLDNPPRSGFALWPRLYLSKPSYVAVATTILSCEAGPQGGAVQAAFNGRATHRPELVERFPAGWLPPTSRECNRAVGPTSDATPPRPPDPTLPPPSDAAPPPPPDGTPPVPSDATPPPQPVGAEPGCPSDRGAWPRPAYELTLGEIVLGPGDNLDVQVPGVDLLGVRPVPNHVTLGSAASPSLSYVGPARFTLALVYSAGAPLLVQQAPSTVRALTAPLDALLGHALSPAPASNCFAPLSPLSLGLILACILALLALRRIQARSPSGAGAPPPGPPAGRPTGHVGSSDHVTGSLAADNRPPGAAPPDDRPTGWPGSADRPPGGPPSVDDPSGSLPSTTHPPGSLPSADRPTDRPGSADRRAGSLAPDDRPAGRLPSADRPPGQVGSPDRSTGSLAPEDDPSGSLPSADRPPGSLAAEDRTSSWLASADHRPGRPASADRSPRSLASADPPSDRLGPADGPPGWLASAESPIGQLAWTALAAIFFFTLPSSFGLLVAAMLWWALTALKPSLRNAVAALLGLACIALALRIDCASRPIFVMLPPEAETSPFTPMVLLPLAAVLSLVLTSNRLTAAARPTVLALAVVLLSVAVFDVVQKSVAVLALIVLATAWLASSVRRQSPPPSPSSGWSRPPQSSPSSAWQPRAPHGTPSPISFRTTPDPRSPWSRPPQTPRPAPVPPTRTPRAAWGRLTTRTSPSAWDRLQQSLRSVWLRLTQATRSAAPHPARGARSVPGEQTSLPVPDRPASSPVFDDPASVPVSDRPASMPLSDHPASVPVPDDPASVPVADDPASVPVSDRPASPPVSHNPALVSVTDAPAPTPASLDPASIPALLERARLCLHGGVVPIGLLLLTVFTFENSLTSTVAYAESFAQWTLWFENLLLLVSIVATFLAVAGLFLLVYPLLPGRIGYIKAVAFGACLLVLFVVGVGADERLIVSLPRLVIGRAVYYLSVPVLLGIYLDLKQHPLNGSSAAPQTRAAPPVGTTPHAPSPPAAPAAATRTPPVAPPPPTPGGAIPAPPDPKSYLDRLRAQINLVGGVASILAPPVYAAVAHSSVVTSYFDLLDHLLKAA